MSDDEIISFWRPQVMRHVHSDGRVEYAIHEVYFSRDKSGGTGSTDAITGYTLAALSERRPTVEGLKEWLGEVLANMEDDVVCGDLRYAYDPESVARWMTHIDDPPIPYEVEDDATKQGGLEGA